MAGIYHPSRGGVRGGLDQFSWENVKTDKDRENYLGHSLMVPVGKWQEGKDLIWYTRNKQEKEDAEAKRKQEINKVKDLESRAMAAALGRGSSSVGTTTLTAKELQEVLSREKTGYKEVDVEKGYKSSKKKKEKKKKKKKKKKRDRDEISSSDEYEEVSSRQVDVNHSVDDKRKYEKGRRINCFENEGRTCRSKSDRLTEEDSPQSKGGHRGLKTNKHAYERGGAESKCGRGRYSRNRSPEERLERTKEYPLYSPGKLSKHNASDSRMKYKSRCNKRYAESSGGTDDTDR